MMVEINWRPMSEFHQPTAIQAGMILLLVRLSDEIEQIFSAGMTHDGKFTINCPEVFEQDFDRLEISNSTIVAWATHPSFIDLKNSN